MIFFKKAKTKKEEEKEVKEELKKEEVLSDKQEEKKSEIADSQNFKNVNFDILKSILITEKASNLMPLNQYCFLVSLKANKNMIKKAVEAKYKVKVLKVNIVRLPSKIKNWRGKESVFQDKKKAIVTLKEGYKIEF